MTSAGKNERSTANIVLSPKDPYLISRVRAALSLLIKRNQYRPIVMVHLPVFGYEGFDAVNFPLLISLLLRAQRLLGV